MEIQNEVTPYESIEQEIYAHYDDLEQSMSKYTPFSNCTQWDALSIYGYVIKNGFSSREDAEKWVIEYYSKNIRNIRQPRYIKCDCGEDIYYHTNPDCIHYDKELWNKQDKNL